MKSQYLDLNSMPLCIELVHNHQMDVGMCSSFPHDQSFSMTTSSFNSLSDERNDVASVERSASSSHQSTNHLMESPLINCPSSFQRDDNGYTMDLVVREPNSDNDHNYSVRLSANDICTNLDFHVVTRFDPTKIELDAIYENKSDLIYHLKMLAISNLFQFHTKRSTKELLHVICVENRSCSWAVRAVRLPRTDMFQIRRYDREHQCPIDARQGKTRQATYDIIADLVKYKYSDVTNKPYPPKAIMTDMCRDHGISMTYKKAWSAKKRAMQLAFGSDAESYAMLPAMSYMLERANPGSPIHITRSSKGVFQNMFFSMSAWRLRWAHCLPVLVIDGTFLKSYYKGTLLTAVAHDGNKQIFPLAFGICDAENDSNWDWFFLKLKEALNTRPVQYILSDRHGAIIKAAKAHFPHIPHGHCVHHILGNIKSQFNGSDKALRWKFFAATRASTKSYCDRYMRLLDDEDPRIRPYLYSTGMEKWARSYFNVNRYSIMTSNNAESMNSVNAAPREYPIAQLVDFIIGRMQKWFHDRRELAQLTSTILTKQCESDLLALHVASAVMMVQPSCSYEYLVVDKKGRSYVVNFRERNCTCGKFQLDHFVCVHAVAAIRNRPGLSCYDYISPLYTSAQWKLAYSGVIHPIPTRDSWLVPDEVATIPCFPPSCTKRPPGRPKKRRIPSIGERRILTCSRCTMSGHNKKTCSNPLPVCRL